MHAHDTIEVRRAPRDQSAGTIPAILLIGAAAVGWAISAVRMAGMDAGPGGELGATGWFMATWVVMMVAMMLPVIVPPAVGYLQQWGRAASAAPIVQGALFVGAYLALWATAGLVAYEVISAGRHMLGGALAWEDGGRWAAAVVLALAAGYQLSARKRRTLEHCRRTHGATGASAGARAGVACLASSWAMMAALFALGVMSLRWMALVAVLIAAERIPRRATPGRFAAAAVFLVLALGIAIAPTRVPGLTIPGSPAAMKAMMRMSESSQMSGMPLNHRATMK
jgi:predicted metal-binding membrane protein